MASLLNFIKIYQLVQKLLGGTHRQTDRLVISEASLSFLRRVRLKTEQGRPEYKHTLAIQMHIKTIIIGGLS
jgi:hypothetical protein